MGITEGCSWALVWGAILEDWLFPLVKSSSPWPRRGPRGAWGAEEGLVKLGVRLAGVNKAQPCVSLLSPLWVGLGAPARGPKPALPSWPSHRGY